MNVFNKNLHIYFTAVVVIFVVVIGSFYIVKGQQVSKFGKNLYVTGGSTLGVQQTSELYSLLVPTGRVGIRVDDPSVALEVSGGVIVDDLTADNITGTSITGTSTVVDKVKLNPPTSVSSATGTLVIVAGSTCPSGAMLVKKYASKTCNSNDTCGSCTIGGDWFSASASDPTCSYDDTNFDQGSKSGDCDLAQICTASTVEAVLCVIN